MVTDAHPAMSFYSMGPNSMTLFTLDILGTVERVFDRTPSLKAFLLNFAPSPLPPQLTEGADPPTHSKRS